MIYIQHKIFKEIKNLCKNRQQDFDSGNFKVSPQNSRSDHKYRLWTCLSELFHARCAYCEKSIVDPKFIEENIMHFRPIVASNDPNLEYNWLSWQWPNLLFVCAECNHARDNQFEIKRKQVTSKTYLIEELQAEVPCLINPCYEDPLNYFEYKFHEKVQRVFIKPKPNLESNQKARVVYTIKTLKLNRPDLRQKRAAAWTKFSDDLELLLKVNDEEKRSKFDRILQDCATESANEFLGLRRFILKKYIDENEILKELAKLFPERCDELFSPNVKLPEAWPDFSEKPKDNTKKPPYIELERPKINDVRLETSLGDNVKDVLRRLYHDQEEISVDKELSKGFSGVRIFIATIFISGNRDSLNIVKIGSPNLIEQEKDAYSKLVNNKLSNAVNLIPSSFSQGNSVSGIKYRFAGNGIFQVDSIKSILVRSQKGPSIQIVKNMFEEILGVLHNYHSHYASAQPDIASIYDRILPVNLVTTVEAEKSNSEITKSYKYAQSDQILELSSQDWMVVEVDKNQKEAILNRRMYRAYPNFPNLGDNIRHVDSFRIKIKFEEEDSFENFDSLRLSDPFFLRVNRTRKTIFDELVSNLSLKLLIRNPLDYLEQILKDTIKGHVSKIHGDLNLENILFEYDDSDDFRKIGLNIIDFADTRCDLSIHDYQRLESGFWLYVVSDEIYKLYKKSEIDDDLLRTVKMLVEYIGRKVDDESLNTPVKLKSLEKSTLVIPLIRRQAKIHVGSIDDYHKGLVLYLLGSLKFSNLDKLPFSPLPKQLAYVVASILTESIFSVKVE